MRVVLTSDDLQAVSQLSRFASSAKSDLGFVCGVPDGERLLWVATNQRCLATLPRGRWEGEAIDVALPLRELSLAAELCKLRRVDQLSLEVAPASGSFQFPGFALPFAGSAEAVLSVRSAARQLGAPDRHLQVNTADLAHVVHAAMAVPPGLRDQDRKQFWLTVDATRSTLTATSSWVGHVDTLALTSCEASSNYEVAVDPSVLLDMALVNHEERFLLESGDDYRTPVRMTTASDLAILVMPDLFGLDADRPLFEKTLAAFLGIEPGALLRDDDGDYPIRLRSEELLYMRLEAGDPMAQIPPHVSLFVILARSVPLDLDALEEINSQNRRVPFATIYRAEDGAVLLEAHCILEGLDPSDLRTTFELVADLAGKVGPWMREFFATGGDVSDR